MDSEKLKIQIGNQIAACRKRQGLTQAELAQKLNYTDKAVSKWERGESVPDVITLMDLAKLFGVSINTLIGEESVAAKAQSSGTKRQVDRNVILMLVTLLVWFVALLVYVILSSLDIQKSWIGFFYAVPVNAIVLLSLRSAWRRYTWNFVLVSVIVWGTLLSFYMTMLVFAGVNLWKLVLLGVMGQAAVCLWFRMFRSVKEEQNG